MDDMERTSKHKTHQNNYLEASQEKAPQYTARKKGKRE